jgi:hypothetical protein
LKVSNIYYYKTRKRKYRKDMDEYKSNSAKMSQNILSAWLVMETKEKVIVIHYFLNANFWKIYKIVITKQALFYDIFETCKMYSLVETKAIKFVGNKLSFKH